jgi:hypothetical protein
VLRFDLEEVSSLISVAVAPDPDGDGPAETVLDSPMDHAEGAGLAAAVNANAWGMVPPPAKGERPRFTEGGACDVRGWVVSNGVPRSPPQRGYWSFWMTRDGTPHIGNIGKTATNVQWAVAGFGGLLRNGSVLPGPSDVRHPRTAAGLDRERKTLVLAVVDGRQPGYSEGVSDRELAELMQELGCADALNLDGGGSSVMILRDGEGPARIVNRPSDLGGPRPVPVLLGVRKGP